MSNFLNTKPAASAAEERIVQLHRQFEHPAANMPNTKSVHVPHLGGIDAAYQMPTPYDASKPTMVLVNSFNTSSELYKSQFANEKLTEKMNLIAIELLGHGQTRTKADHFTYWDTAIMNIQVLEKLGMCGDGKKVFVLDTSQGGWITVRMALIAPDRASIIPLGTSMDYESERTRKLGCWDAPTGLTPTIDACTTNSATPDFEPGDDYCNFLIDTGFGKECAAEAQKYWISEIKANYKGDEGRRRLRMAAINLKERDGLHSRLFDVRCPVLWLHGTSDVVYSAENAREEIALFVNSQDAKLKVIENGQHFLSFSHPKEVDEALLEFVGRYEK
ncbi:alpha/beta-hydrolase [Hortaea werneckii]|nr:alpha/beta-hydrolase [Hortaea werneckii]KAI7014733.1 alpha/beta-hydrolase [Hortaea werneckii]KAI7025956.1 alpha/beta-hydrolase [Hortaea werneckii]KAI7123311.1 alpha/beta-hydrolase [Hortaea werneckii]KAI7286772.1 alpha/beta-hydrolase [Hortaea werneckii]